MFAAIRLASSLVSWRKTKMYRGILERLRRIDQGLAREPHQHSVGRGHGTGRAGWQRAIRDVVQLTAACRN
jgi:hypothetical protein